jgi:cobalt/nickel transport system permease protein
MHISDGILSPEWCVVWYALSAVFVVVGAIEISRRRKANPVYMSMIALMGAAIFVISVWHIPVPVTGSCSHPTGTPLAAMIVGPFATVIISGIALFFQVFLGHGGLTTLGANLMSMGIAGTFTGYFTFRAMKKAGVSIWLSAGLGGLVGDLVTYVVAALEIALSIHPSNLITYWGVYTLGFLPTQIPLAILEFAFTAAAIQYIADHRPEVLKWWMK